ncbi:MAG: hypothetical protein Q7U44_06435 [Desulfuromonadales bacterium]|nr:hypothetical protein [Desulfuromonadales bacterium]
MKTSKSKQNCSDELRQTLFEELRTLRQTVREVGESFILRKEGEIEALLNYLLEMRPAQVEKFGRSWLRESRELSIKPTKGRIKDLRRLDALLEDLLSNVIEADVPAKKSRVTPPKRLVQRKVKETAPKIDIQ